MSISSLKSEFILCAPADSNPLDHQVLDVALPEYFPSAKRPRVSLCKTKAAPEESYSRGSAQESPGYYIYISLNILFGHPFYPGLSFDFSLLSHGSLLAS